MHSLFEFANANYKSSYWLTFFFLLFFSFNVFAGSATLTWNPSSSSGVTAYKLYYGQSSRNYSSNINVGLATSYTVTDLQDGQTYYFAVTATDGSSESGYSDEVSKAIPAPTDDGSFRLSLIDSSTDREVGVFIEQNSAININELGFDQFNIALDAYPSKTESARFTLTGPISRSAVENHEPYAMFGDSNGDYKGRPLTIGAYSLRLELFDQGNAGGNKLTDETVSFSFVSSSTPEPLDADFTADVTSGTVPLLVRFTGRSTGTVTDWAWNFGDGTTSSAKTAIKSYSKPGSYTVSLNTSGPNGSDTVTKTNFISVSSAAPVAAFSAIATSGTVPLTVEFNDKSTGTISDWKWDFGDGTSSSSRNPNHTYTSAGTYNVTLTVSGMGGKDQETKSNYITVEEDSTSTRITDGQLVLYTFEAGAGHIVYDLSKVGNPLDLTISDPDAVTWLAGGGLSIDSPTTIKSLLPADKINIALQNSQALTVEAWMASNDLSQSGPTRIVALSENSLFADVNFILGQSDSRYIARLRTSVISPYDQLSVSTPAYSVTHHLTHVVYTRDAHGITRFYLDGLEVAADWEVAANWQLGDFSNWGNYTLALANKPELGMWREDHPWLGELHLVAIYDHALGTTEVEANYLAGP